MKIPDVERSILDWLWPIRPFDAPIVGACAITVSLFWAGSQTDAWPGLWAGTALGLFVVLTRVRRRARRGPRSCGEPTARAEAAPSVETINRSVAP
jgi:hypothetical protein